MILTSQCWNLASVWGIIYHLYCSWEPGSPTMSSGLQEQPLLGFMVMLIFLSSACSLWLWRVECLLGTPVQYNLPVDFPALCSIFILVCTLLWAILSLLPTSSVTTMVFQPDWLWVIAFSKLKESSWKHVSIVSQSPSQGKCCHTCKCFLIQCHGLYRTLMQRSQNPVQYTFSQLLWYMLALSCCSSGF